jgi:hypothetical protein
MLRKLLPLTLIAACGIAVPAGVADAAAPLRLELPSSVRVTEGKDVKLRVALKRRAQARTVVRWSLAGNSDFVATKGSVTIPQGRRTATLRLRTRQDALQEGNERFTLKVARRSIRVTIADDDRAPVPAAAGSAAQGATVPAPRPAPADPQPPVVTPPPAEALPVVSVPDEKRGEGPGSWAAPSVVLSRPSAKDVTVHYAYEDGTAKAGLDFSATEGIATIEAGRTTAKLPLQVVADQIDEDDGEHFTVRLSAPQNATVADDTGTITIVDDDAKPQLRVNGAATRVENATTMQFSVSLTHPSVHPVTVKLSTGGGTATGGGSCQSPGTDYVQLSALALTLSPGQTSKTVNVTLCEDQVAEPDETVRMFVSELSSAAAIGDPEGTGLIQDDD